MVNHSLRPCQPTKIGFHWHFLQSKLQIAPPEYRRLKGTYSDTGNLKTSIQGQRIRSMPCHLHEQILLWGCSDLIPPFSGASRELCLSRWLSSSVDMLRAAAQLQQAGELPQNVQLWATENPNLNPPERFIGKASVPSHGRLPAAY